MSAEAAQSFLRRWRPGPLLPRGDTRDGGLVFVIAVLCFFACLSALAALAADRAARGWATQLQGSATVLVRPRGGESVDAAAARAAETLAGVKGVNEAVALEKDKAVALLQPWLGKDVLAQGGGPGQTGLADDLPIPRLVTLELDKNAPPSADTLDRALRAQGIDATVDDHSLWIGDIVRAGRWARAAAAGVFALTALAAAAVIAYAARSALAARREIVEVLHISGAQESFIAGLLVRRFAQMAFGAGVAAAVFAALAGAAARLAGGGAGLTPALPVAWIDLLALLPCPFLAAGVAALAVRLAALRLLKDMATREETA
jgi:cell division transport system permease protein